MTQKDFEEGMAYLKNGEQWDYVEHDGRKVEVSNMCGGRYLAYDTKTEVCGQTNDEWRAMAFLATGNTAVFH